MQFVTDVRTLLAFGFFRRLFAVRLVSQLTDGVLQVALASYVLFSPERQPSATAIAAGFAALLLPFSVLGPFCGVLLDRWSRRQVLAWSNAVRALLVVPIVLLVVRDVDGPVFFGLILACLSVNRFLLSALSAALPHVVPADRLVMANAVSPTCGTLAYLVGLGLGSGIATLSRGVPTGSEGVVLTVAAAGYVAASLLALRMPRRLLGPDLETAKQDVREAVRHVMRGLVGGGRHVAERRSAARALGLIGAHRFFYGISTVSTILLYRNHFHPGEVSAGLTGMATVVLVSGLGFGTAAFLTPIAVRRIRKETWMVALMALAGVAQLVPATSYTEAGILVAAYLLGVTAQGIKICVDTLVQQNVDDVFRGRVFSFYDVLFNVVFVGAAAVAAATLPESGKSYLMLGIGAVGYLLAAVWYSRRTGLPNPPAEDGRAARATPANEYLTHLAD